MSRPVYIVAYNRTPTGSFLGGLSTLSAPELGALAIKGALEQTGLSDWSVVDEVLMGNVLSAGMGQAPAANAARLAGVPLSVPATTLNKVCASGMKTIMVAAQSIMCGQAELVVAGGMESMSQVPFILPQKTRSGGMKFGQQAIVDLLQIDGLTDAETKNGMGMCAEKCANDYNISRTESDMYAKQSFERALAEETVTFIAGEVTPVVVSPAVTVSTDEQLKMFKPEKMMTLKAAFVPNGTATAANSSPMSDGAAAVVVASAEAVQKYGLKVLAKIIGFADASHSGMDFPTAPALAVPKALRMAGKTIEEVDLFEINEAFSTVALANAKILGIDQSRLNIFGGAVARGHPLGCSGTRITGTLARMLKHKGGKIGVASICNGGGGGSAIVLEVE